MQHLRIQERPSGKADVLIIALAGWLDAAEGATAAVRYLLRQFKGEKFADLDPEEFYDFAHVRPYIRLTQEGLRRVRWPANELSLSTTGQSGPGLMFLLGVEPSLKWRTYSETIIELAQSCGVGKVVQIGALMDSVPHTRPMPLTAAANKLELNRTIEDLGMRLPRYQGPSGITSAMMEACNKADLAFFTLFAHAPHYLHAAPNHVISHALIKALSSLLNIKVGLQEMEAASGKYLEEISTVADQDPQLSDYIKRLEERYDSAEDASKEIPRPDEMVRELENFLREHHRQIRGGDST